MRFEDRTCITLHSLASSAASKWQDERHLGVLIEMGRLRSIL